MTKEAENKVIKTFNDLCYNKDHRKVFENILDFIIFTATIENETKDDFPKDMVKKLEYKEKLLKGYSMEERILFAEVITLLGEATTTREDRPAYYDALGDLFMNCISSNSGKGRNDQHFTPHSVCDLCVAMSDFSTGNSVCDPTCGSGRFLLAVAKRNNKLTFFGSDIDLLCVKMCVVNMMLNGLKSEIVHGNPLTLEAWATYQTELNSFNMPTIRILKGEKSAHFKKIDKEVVKEKKQTPIQLNFDF